MEKIHIDNDNDLESQLFNNLIPLEIQENNILLEIENNDADDSNESQIFRDVVSIPNLKKTNLIDYVPVQRDIDSSPN